jgi:hypothetical protein
MFFGMIHQITAYLLLIQYSDWQKVIYETEDRQEKENENVNVFKEKDSKVEFKV